MCASARGVESESSRPAGWPRNQQAASIHKNQIDEHASQVMQHAAEIATSQVSRVMAESLCRLADADLTQADANRPRRSLMVTSVNCE